MLIVIEWLSLLLRINIYCKYMVILVISIHQNNLLQQQLWKLQCLVETEWQAVASGRDALDAVVNENNKSKSVACNQKLRVQIILYSQISSVTIDKKFCGRKETGLVRVGHFRRGAAGRGGCDTQWTTWELFQHDDAVADDDDDGDDDDGDADARRC